eukprot:scaffold1638_cov258-Pinguiococcus_pyrenoidosus.AAC.61
MAASQHGRRRLSEGIGFQAHGVARRSFSENAMRRTPPGLKSPPKLAGAHQKKTKTSRDSWDAIFSRIKLYSTFFVPMPCLCAMAFRPNSERLAIQTSKGDQILTDSDLLWKLRS